MVVDLIRLDRFLVEKQLAPSRSRAQALILEGLVRVKGIVISDVSFKISNSCPVNEVEVAAGDSNRFVSRGGLKLEGALKKINLNVKNLDALDVGQSTGGFTDCLLQAGIRSVVGLDVGHDQLAKNLRDDSRVTVFEGVNARDLINLTKTNTALGNALCTGFDLAVLDLSFISLTHVVDPVCKFLKPKGILLGLVKPQFEVGPSNLGKKGIVKNEKLFEDVEKKVRDAAENVGLSVQDFFPSPIDGGDGNREFFIYAQKPN